MNSPVIEYVAIIGVCVYKLICGREGRIRIQVMRPGRVSEKHSVLTPCSPCATPAMEISREYRGNLAHGAGNLIADNSFD